MKKILVVFLAVAMLFAFSAAALAAPSDLGSEPTAVQDAFNKFIAYGFLNGYEDGTIRPNGEITRAEFAKIICMMTNNESLGNALMNTSSQFKDVTAGAWYTGWINGATAAGYFNGYTDGTFKPNAPITDAEVVTVLLRLAGYNDSLPGAWPFNYIVKANQLELIKEAPKFSSGSNSPRANVVLLANALLDKDIYMVNFSKDIESFVNRTGNPTVASFYNAIGNTAEYAVDEWTVNAKGELTLRAVDENSALKTLVFAADYQVADGLSAYELDGLSVKITLNKDGKIVFVAAQDQLVLTKSYSKTTTNATNPEREIVTINGVRYTNGLVDANGDPAQITLTSGKTYEFIVNKDGQVISAAVASEVGTATVYGVVKSITSAGVITSNTQLQRAGSFATATNLNNKNLVVLVDGKLASIEDIEVNSFVMQYANVHGVDYLYDVVSPVVASVSSITGSSSGDIAQLVANGTTYRKDALAVTPNEFKVAIKGIADDYVALTSTLFNDNSLKGVDAIAIANKTNIIALSYGEVKGTTSSVIGIITGATIYTESTVAGQVVENTAKGYSNITVVNAAGETKTYTVKENGTKINYFFTDNTRTTFVPVVVGTLITLTVDANDIVQNVVDVTVTSPGSITVNKARTVADFGGGDFYGINSNTVYMVVTMDGTKIKSIEIKSLADVLSGDTITANTIEARISNGVVTHMVLTGVTATTADKYAVIRDLYYNGDQVRLWNGEVYDKVAGFNNADQKAGELVEYTVSNDEITVVNVAIALGTTTGAQVAGTDLASFSEEVASITSSVIRLNNDSYMINEDTLVVIYEVVPAAGNVTVVSNRYIGGDYTYSDISKGDFVYIIDDGSGNASVIVIVR